MIYEGCTCRAILLVHPRGSVVHSELLHKYSRSLCKITFLCQGEDGRPLYKSIHVDDLPELLTQLVSGPLGQWYLEKENKPLIQSNVTSHLLREYLLAGGKHPARDYHHLFSREFPHAALSYEWKLGMLDVSNVLRDPLVLNHPELLLKKDVRRGKDGKANPRVWIDIFFIDQVSKNIRVELGIAQEYYILCILHIVAGSESFLTRGWCLWELGLRAHAKKRSLIVGSLGNTVSAAIEFNDVWNVIFILRLPLQAAELGNKFYENMKLFDPSDRSAIEWGLKRVFDYDKGKINRAITAQVSHILVQLLFKRDLIQRLCKQIGDNSQCCCLCIIA
jgi:hypothetical protein